ncbi:bifunctional nuclease family protein [Amycolatopsis nigrescens]|uniref:bifunctional nuclease family protein n=1 Tax=Amycolatopsis nigrescens TaxID=381445 RepID=UPI000476934E|nr:bifunctional nuclease family protein [Amycolatopsis nigrescens]
MVPVDFHGLAVVSPDTAPVVLLREAAGERRWLLISIGAPEAEALLAAKEAVVNPRPGTIELIGQVIGTFGRQVAGVEVTALREGIFHADLVLDNDVRISARPSDALAIGIRAGVPMRVVESVLDEAGVELAVLDAEGQSGTGEPPDLAGLANREQEIEQFRELLEGVDPDDFRDTGGN